MACENVLRCFNHFCWFRAACHISYLHIARKVVNHYLFYRWNKSVATFYHGRSGSGVGINGSALLLLWITVFSCISLSKISSLRNNGVRILEPFIKIPWMADIYPRADQSGFKVCLILCFSGHPSRTFKTWQIPSSSCLFSHVKFHVRCRNNFHYSWYVSFHFHCDKAEF